MNLLVAVDNNWGIGCENNLLFHIREDMQRFKLLTTGKVVVMGHNTLRSFKGGRPLPNRVNVVLSGDTGLEIPGAEVCNSIPELTEALRFYPPEDIFVIGGEAVYTQLLDYCNRAYVTRINATAQADTFFPNLDDMENWRLNWESSIKQDGEIFFKFCVYCATKK